MVAAGNGADDVDKYSPASCSGVITVAATTREGGLTSYTNTGAGIDVSAPGGDLRNGLLVISNNGDTLPVADDFLLVAGTSYAAAQVSGITALMLSVNEDLNPLQVRNILVGSARPFADASCNPLFCGSGIVDASAAVQQAGATPGQPDSDNDGFTEFLMGLPHNFANQLECLFFFCLAKNIVWEGR